jgi:hypothetical protein
MNSLQTFLRYFWEFVTNWVTGSGTVFATIEGERERERERERENESAS